MQIKICFIILVILIFFWVYIFFGRNLTTFTGGEGINFMPSILMANENRQFQRDYAWIPNYLPSQINRLRNNNNNVAMDTSSLARQQIKSQRGISQLSSANTLPSAGLTLIR